MKLLRWLNKRMGIVETDPEVNAALSAADIEQDRRDAHAATHAGWIRRGYRYVCDDETCPEWKDRKRYEGDRL